MADSPATVLDQPAVYAALKQAWEDSQPGPMGGHEEGGFILRDVEGNFSVERWPPGGRNRIIVPRHLVCKRDDREIVATFHTHPNTGAGFLQAPSDTDIRAVRDDPNLKGGWYEGEFVISQKRIYKVIPSGQVVEVGATGQVFAGVRR